MMVKPSDSDVLSILFQIKRIDTRCLCLKYMEASQDPARCDIPVIYFYHTALTEDTAKSIMVQLLGSPCIFTSSTELFVSRRVKPCIS